MLTRRQTALGFASMALGSAVVSSASFFSSTAAGADLRVVVSSELTLTPGRVGGAYVETDQDGEVEGIAIAHLNQRSISRFEDLIQVTNNGDVPYDRLEFSFAASDPNSDAADVAEALRVVSTDASTQTDEQGQTTLLANPNETLESGDVIAFGMIVNLIPGDAPGTIEDLSDTSSVTLEITAVE